MKQYGHLMEVNNFFTASQQGTNLGKRGADSEKNWMTMSLNRLGESSLKLRH